MDFPLFPNSQAAGNRRRQKRRCGDWTCAGRMRKTWRGTTSHSEPLLPGTVRGVSTWRIFMTLTKEQIAQQQKQAEELLFSGPQTLGFAKGLFFGHFNAPLLFPYPVLRPQEQAEAEQAVAEVRRFAE